MRGWFAPQLLGEDGRAQIGGRVPVETLPAALIPGTWMQVTLTYDRARLRLAVDGAPMAEMLETARVWPMDSALVLSPGTSPWDGAVDSLVVSCVAASDEARLPRTATLAPGTPAQVVFAAGGGLDRSVHREPVRIGVLMEDGRRFEVLVNLYGTVE